MKNLFRKIVPSVLVLVLSGMAAFGQGHPATIDLKKVFESYWKTKEADAALKERAADLDKQYKSLATDWQKSRDAYEKLLASAKDPAIAADERDKRQKTAEAKLLEIKENEQTIDSFRRQATATLDEQNRRMRDKILGEIRDAVKAKAKSAGYTMVFDSAAESVNNTAVLLYTNGENDITDEILSQLNSTAPVGSAKPVADKPVAGKPADKTSGKK